MGKGILIAILLIVLGAVVGLIWVRSAHGFSATAQPTWIEARLAGLSRWLSLTNSEDQARNPYPATPQRLAQARQLYHDQCALCHNNNGDAKTPVGQSLYPKASDLRGATQRKSDGALFYSIRNGIRLSGMPAWPQDSDEQVWGLVSLLRTMKVSPGGAAPMKATP